MCPAASIVRDDLNTQKQLKRQKPIPAQTNELIGLDHGSRLFAPYRTLGLISPTQVPFSVVTLGKSTYQITTSVGRCLHTYDLRRGLKLIFVTRPLTPGAITACAAWKDKVIAAWRGGKGGLWTFKRGVRVAELRTLSDDFGICSKLLIFGQWITAIYDQKIEVWASDTFEHYTTLRGGRTPHQAEDEALYSGSACTLPTYLNKIFVGRTNGCIEIWNVKTGKLLYTMNPKDSHCGAVTAVTAAPALSLLAVGYGCGRVAIRDVDRDREIVVLTEGEMERNAVASISFRSDELGREDDGKEMGGLAVAHQGVSDVTLWSLAGGPRRSGRLRDAHITTFSTVTGRDEGITGMEILTGQSVMVTAGSDNSLKTWTFDSTTKSGLPKLLHHREGHAAPVTRMDFLSSDSDLAASTGKWLLTGSLDHSLWNWSLRNDSQSAEISQGHIHRQRKKIGKRQMQLENSSSDTASAAFKAPTITGMACCLNRDGGMGALPGTRQIWSNPDSGKVSKTLDAYNTGWESIVTCHKGDSRARTWFWGRRRAGRWAFLSKDGAEVTAVALSPCGTFALLGSAAGGICMYNLQSGIYRQSFPTAASSGRVKLSQLSIAVQTNGEIVKQKPSKHTGAITGLCVDNVNRRLVSCGLDGKIKFWDFLSASLISELEWSMSAPVTTLRFYRPNELVALSADDFSLGVVDIQTRKLVRIFKGCTGRILDFCFSADGRWIIATSEDKVVRVWDILTGHLIDALRFSSQCLSVAASSTGEFLATTHDDSVGIYLWTNRTLFTHVPHRMLRMSDVAEIDVTDVFGERPEALLQAKQTLENDTAQEEDLIETIQSTSDQLSSELQTLSLVPRARWQTLLHLELIRQRNKPVAPPEKSKTAPFFLPLPPSNPEQSTDIGKSNGLAVNGSPANIPGGASRHRVVQMADRVQSYDNQLSSLLQESRQFANHEPVIVYLSALPSSAADLAIRSLSTSPPYDGLISLIEVFTASLMSRRNYEMIQVWIAVFLRIHGDLIAVDAGLSNALKAFRDEHVIEQKRLGQLASYCSGVSTFVRGGLA